MDSTIRWKDSEAYELAITQWLIKTLHESEIKETHFSRDAGLGRNDTDARTFRKIKEGNRHWSIVDLCKLAAYFNLKPSDVLSRVEAFYEEEGIVIPGKTVERIIELGFSKQQNTPTLISTWKKKGKGFYFLDCDPSWKKEATGVISRIIGMTSKQIFPYHPEITTSFQNAWDQKGEDAIELEYGVSKKINNQGEKPDGLRTLRVNSKFVPPDFIVVYVDDVSGQHL